MTVVSISDFFKNGDKICLKTRYLIGQLLKYWTQLLQLFFHEINLLYIVTCIVSLSNTGKQQFFANQLSDRDRSVPNDIDLDRPICVVTNNNIFEIRGYVWCVQYRVQIHLRTKKGSGGVGFLI